MNEKPKNQPKSTQITVVRFAAGLGIVVILLAIGMLYKIPDETGQDRAILLVWLDKLIPPEPVQFSGENWEMLVNVERVVDNTGTVTVSEYSHRVVVEMQSDGNTLTGTYISASETVCSNAEFVGTIDGDKIDWVVTYSGSCCPTAKMHFTGTVAESRQRIDGEFSPIGLPPENCWIWWGDVTMFPQ